MLKIYKKEGLYGITDNGNDNVPFIYEKKRRCYKRMEVF